MNEQVLEKKPGFRRKMAGVHIWSGLVLGWILFAIFLTGTASYFRHEITAWMQPERFAIGEYTQSERHAITELTVAKLERVAPDATRWFIDPPDERRPVTTALWLDNSRTPPFERYTLDPVTGSDLAARETHGGEFFYRFHYELLIRPLGGRWIVGLAAMIMLVAIITGVVTHRRIFRDFFTFRPRKRGQRGWLDAHNLLAVLALPFHLMITYTGLITFMVMYMPWGIFATYDGDASRFFAEAGRTYPPAIAAGKRKPLASVGDMVEAARPHLTGGKVGQIRIDHPGDANARVIVSGKDGQELSHVRDYVVFDGTTGEVIEVPKPEAAATSTYGVLYGLHIARFANPFLRWLFFVSGVMGTAMVATGLVLWTVKRREKRDHSQLGLRLVDILNTGTIVGLPIGIACYFWANRLLPADMAARADNELLCLFGAWAAAALYPALRPGRRAWAEELTAASALFLLLPVLNALTTESHLGVTLPAGAWDLAGFDLAMIVFGLALGWTARAVARRGGTVKAAPVPAAPE